MLRDAVPFFVMAGLRPGHPRLFCLSEDKTWMPGTRPGMTNSKATKGMGVNVISDSIFK
jgi:hypothetical protein